MAVDLVALPLKRPLVDRCSDDVQPPLPQHHRAVFGVFWRVDPREVRDDLGREVVGVVVD